MTLNNQPVRTVRNLTEEEYDLLGWHDAPGHNPRAIELENGTVLVPSGDFEGNHPGFFARLSDLEDNIEGMVIDTVTAMGIDYMRYMDWHPETAHQLVPVIHFADNEDAAIFPMADAEGNGPGALFEIEDGDTFCIDFDVTPQDLIEDTEE